MPIYQRGIDISETSPRRPEIFRKFQYAEYKGNYRRSHNSPDGFEIIVNKQDLEHNGPEPKPLDIVQTRYDKSCSRCGAVKGEAHITKSGTVVPGGLELIFDRGDMFGARCLCHNCGFSF